ncbi:unnamed protein product [Prorocentrum cordatum]|uniref:Uncharacterized protein n=1 Tax=Prorocentrum cordatum TaxID=2364126 RepID=A0ABN9QQ10_9DINO|nr:unnamed protein product [Polarella glacialis]
MPPREASRWAATAGRADGTAAVAAPPAERTLLAGHLRRRRATRSHDVTFEETEDEAGGSASEAEGGALEALGVLHAPLADAQQHSTWMEPPASPEAMLEHRRNLRRTAIAAAGISLQDTLRTYLYLQQAAEQMKNGDWAAAQKAKQARARLAAEARASRAEAKRALLRARGLASLDKTCIEAVLAGGSDSATTGGPPAWASAYAVTEDDRYRFDAYLTGQGPRINNDSRELPNAMPAPLPMLLPPAAPAILQAGYDGGGRRHEDLQSHVARAFKEMGTKVSRQHSGKTCDFTALVEMGSVHIVWCSALPTLLSKTKGVFAARGPCSLEAFRLALAELCRDQIPVAWDPRRELESVKYCFYEASTAARHAIRSRKASTLQGRRFHALVALRAVRLGQPRRLQQTVGCHPRLRAHFSQGLEQRRNIDGLCQHVRALHIKILVRSDLWTHIEPHIQRFEGPLEIDWQIPSILWYDTILHRPNRIPGPDGIPYSTWRNGPAARVLYDVYSLLFTSDIDSLPRSMLGRLVVFLPEGTDPQDPGDGTALVRHPSCTRPLSMSNTDIKPLANAMTIALTSNLSHLVDQVPTCSLEPNHAPPGAAFFCPPSAPTQPPDSNTRAMDGQLVDPDRAFISRPWGSSAVVLMLLLSREPRPTVAPCGNPGHIGDILEAVLGLCVPFNKARLPIRDRFGQARHLAELDFRRLRGHIIPSEVPVKSGVRRILSTSRLEFYKQGGGASLRPSACVVPPRVTSLSRRAVASCAGSGTLGTDHAQAWISGAATLGCRRPPTAAPQNRRVAASFCAAAPSMSSGGQRAPLHPPPPPRRCALGGGGCGKGHFEASQMGVKQMLFRPSEVDASQDLERQVSGATGRRQPRTRPP